MSTIQLNHTFSQPPDDVFAMVCVAVDDLGQYAVTHVHPEVASGQWSCKGPPQLFLEVQVVPNAQGSRVELELRDASFRDRLGLRRREARRVITHIAAHVQAGASGLGAVQPAPAPLTDRQVIAAALAAAMGLAVVGSFIQCAMGLFTSG